MVAEVAKDYNEVDEVVEDAVDAFMGLLEVD